MLISDLRSLECVQSFWQRMINIGNIIGGTAGQSGVKIEFIEISRPKQVYQMIRDLEQKRKTILSD